MWVCFNNAFVSAVQDREHPDGLVVRARRKKHLEAIFPDRNDIIGMKGSDYKWRIFCTKLEFAEIVRKSIMDIDYDNFKNSVKDKALHDMYLDVWSAGYHMQMGK